MDKKVRDIMTKDVIAVELPGTRKEALKLMVKHERSGLVVVKKGTKEVVGVVTRKDIFKKSDEEHLAMIITRNPVTTTPDASIESVAWQFFENKIDRLPVIENNELVGIVTPTDLLEIIESGDFKDPIENFITFTCVPIYEETPLDVVVNIMKIAHAYALPVLNDEPKLVGIVTDRDIFSHSKIDYSIAHSDLGLGDDEDQWTWEGLRNIMKLYYAVEKVELPKVAVKEIMVKDVITVYEKTSVSKAASLMRKNDVGQLPVTDSEDRLIGMIYNIDLLPALFT